MSDYFSVNDQKDKYFSKVNTATNVPTEPAVRTALNEVQRSFDVAVQKFTARKKR